MKTDCPAWAPPLLAVQFLTRVPVPGLAGLNADQARLGLARSAGWFPLVGALVGACTAATMLIAETIWPRAVAVVVALIVEARLTGAFHEDAVADFCDGIGGGRNAEHVREIMKDSRIGTYGALALILAVGLRGVLMFSLEPAQLFMVLVASASFGRLFAVNAMAMIPPAPRSAGLSKDVSGDLRVRDVALAWLTACVPLGVLAVVAPFALAAAFVASSLCLLWLRSVLLQKVGGHTGDCLGFSAFAGQVILLLAAVAL